MKEGINMINKRYIIINSSDIIKKYHKDNQEHQDNLLVNEILKKYNIPNNLRKIIIKTNHHSQNNNSDEYYELTTEIPFKIDILKNLENNEILMGGYFDNNSHTEINTVIKWCHPKDIKTFYHVIIELGLAKEYMMAIKEILSNKLDIEKEPLFKKRTLTK